MEMQQPQPPQIAPELAEEFTAMNKALAEDPTADVQPSPELRAHLDAVLGPQPDFSENLKAQHHDPEQDALRARQTFPRTYVDDVD